jgi:hypothetical protein
MWEGIQFLYCCVHNCSYTDVAFRFPLSRVSASVGTGSGSGENVFTELLPSNSRLSWLHSYGSQQTCDIICT